MRSPIDQYIIDQVYFRRKALKVSQLTLAYAIGHKSVAYIAAIESMNPERTECYNSKQLNLIAKCLACSPKDFQPESALTEYASSRIYVKRERRSNRKIDPRKPIGIKNIAGGKV